MVFIIRSEKVKYFPGKCCRVFSCSSLSRLKISKDYLKLRVILSDANDGKVSCGTRSILLGPKPKTKPHGTVWKSFTNPRGCFSHSRFLPKPNSLMHKACHIRNSDKYLTNSDPISAPRRKGVFSVEEMFQDTCVFTLLWLC